MLPFAVVEFLDGSGVAIVSSKWLLGKKKSYFPAKGNRTRYAMNHKAVGSTWGLYDIKAILGEFGTLEKSQLNCSKLM